MASIKLQGDTSGELTISVPAVAGTNTITLPASTGTVLTDTAPKIGNILQVVSGITTTSTSQTSTTWTDTTLTANITPTSTSNKILILVNQSVRIQRSTYYTGGSIKILRGSTFLYYAAENDVPYYPSFETPQGTGGINFYNYFNLNYLDSPSSTSALTYKTQQRSSVSADLINTQQGGAASTIILMEIAG
tara:strand:- start:227 stop:799 length:573 start_codon:yes stop_codon:yes gene_type:complete